MNGVTAIFSKQNARDLQPPYSHAEALSSKVPARWVYWKDLGNEAVKAKDLSKAALLYLNALCIADGTGSGYRRIFLQGFKPETAVYRAVASEYIHLRILDFLALPLREKRITFADGTSCVYNVPNLPAAVVHSNISHVFLQMAGNKGSDNAQGPTTTLDKILLGKSKTWAELAFMHALRAVTVCGEYESLRRIRAIIG
jgi:hypothetical protein